MAVAAHERDYHGPRVTRAIADTATDLRRVALFGTPSQLEAITIRTAVEAAIKGTSATTNIERNRQVGEDPYTVVLQVPSRARALEVIERAGEHVSDRRTRMAFKRTARLAIERTLPSPRRRAAT